MLRQDPDVILIGEMRDEETVGTALSAAETGHLVLSTLHTIDAVETINRIIDFFPPHHHQQVRAMLAGSLRGVISQRLVPTSTARAASPCCEVLTMTGRVRDMIVDPNETGKLGEVIAEGSYYGMQTFDQALLQLYQDGKISMDEALKAATTRTTSSCWSPRRARSRAPRPPRLPRRRARDRRPRPLRPPRRPRRLRRLRRLRAAVQQQQQHAVGAPGASRAAGPGDAGRRGAGRALPRRRRRLRRLPAARATSPSSKAGAKAPA